MQERIEREPILLQKGDWLLLKKCHPCGENLFLVLRVGSNLQIRCRRCGKDLTIPRLKLEPRIKMVNP